jgi:hypothetical protein
VLPGLFIIHIFTCLFCVELLLHAFILLLDLLVRLQISRLGIYSSSDFPSLWTCSRTIRSTMRIVHQNKSPSIMPPHWLTSRCYFYQRPHCSRSSSAYIPCVPAVINYPVLLSFVAKLSWPPRNRLRTRARTCPPQGRGAGARQSGLHSRRCSGWGYRRACRIFPFLEGGVFFFFMSCEDPSTQAALLTFSLTQWGKETWLDVCMYVYVPT